jgi:uncharacterized cupredoxin-like copper-binding protein
MRSVTRITVYAEPTASGRRLRTMKGTLVLAALALILALVLASCGGGASSYGGSSGGGASSSGKATTGGSSGGGGYGYGGGNTSSSSAATTRSSSSGGVIKTVAIKESEFKLSPSTVTLSKPGTYAFKAENEGSYQHSLEIEGKGLKSKEGEAGEAKLEPYLDPGQSGVLTVSFQIPGTYEMYCPVDGHEQEGMKGKVVVK